jgi:hypothetical protein
MRRKPEVFSAPVKVEERPRDQTEDVLDVALGLDVWRQPRLELIRHFEPNFTGFCAQVIDMIAEDRVGLSTPWV